MTTQGILWVTCILMALGAAAILAISGKRTEDEETDGILHGLVPIIAACSYFAMATHQGAITLPLGAAADAGRDFYYARYVDWLFTTPILLYALSSTATHSASRRHGAVFGLLLADVLMIATALFFGASEAAWIKWTWFVISSAAFLGVYYVIWGPLRAEAAREREDVRAIYATKATILSVLWFIYPVVLALGVDGLRVMGPAATTLAIAVLDVIAKVVYGLTAVRNRKRVVDRDLSEGSISEEAGRTASHRRVA